MSDIVVALVTVVDACVYTGDEWPSDASRVLANPEWFTAPRVQGDTPEPVVEEPGPTSIVESGSVEEPASEPEAAPAE